MHSAVPHAIMVENLERSPTHMHHTDAELDRLEEMLGRLPADNDGMSLSEFDGFWSARS